MRRRMVAVLMAASLMTLATQPALAIVYGSKGDGGHPNVGALVTKDGPNIIPVCTGTIVRDGTGNGNDRGSFLTAAHCIVVLEEYGGFIPGDVYITFEDKIGPSGLIPISDGEAHPRFNQRQSNPFDIGVLMFDARTGLGASPVADIGDLDISSRTLQSKRFRTVGYGVTRDTKQKAHQGIDPLNVDRRYADQGAQSLTKAWLTLAMNDRAVTNGGTCYGDSGGPHYDGNVIVSITVTGDTFCKATDRTYRLDTAWAHDFLEPYLGS